MKLKEIADRVNAHLKRMAKDEQLITFQMGDGRERGGRQGINPLVRSDTPSKMFVHSGCRRKWSYNHSV